METFRIRKKCRNHRHLQFPREQLSITLLIMTFGYLLGCVIGVFVAINTDVDWMYRFPSDLVAKQSVGLFTIFCGYAAYGLCMLFLATSYYGFLLIPGIFSVKGFFSASVLTASFRSTIMHGLGMTCLELFLPGVFLLPALLILGQCSINGSVRLLRCRSGEYIPPNSSLSRAIGASLIFLLMASAIKAYVVPFILNLF